MRVQLPLALLASAVSLSGCTLVLSSTPCDTALVGDSGPDTGDSADTGIVDRTAAALAAGGHHTCALDSDGGLDCWGFDGGLGVSTPSVTENVAAVSAGYLFTCAHDGADSSLPTCWGDDAEGQASPTEAVTPLLAAGGAHACAEAAGGGVTCWGRSTEGQTTPDASLAGVDVSLLASGWLFSCAQGGAGVPPVCWGHDTLGQVSGVPATPMADIALGQGFGVGLPEDLGPLACWGDPDFCSLVDTVSTGFTAITAGLDFACALQTDLTPKCWGTNENGVLDALPSEEFTTLVAGPGSRHICGITTDDRVACWGLDTSGQASP